MVVVYSPGDGQEPRAWRQDDWKPGAALVVGGAAAMTPLFGWQQTLENRFAPEGFLAAVEAEKPGDDMMTPSPLSTKPHEKDICNGCLLLSLYGTLPPAEFWNAQKPEDSPDYFRRLGRGMDLSPLLALRRVIVMGHLDLTGRGDVPLPEPLKIDGVELGARGWVFVRFIVPVE